jgi:uncharacterized coiled-coil DUF342 family protein
VRRRGERRGEVTETDQLRAEIERLTVERDMARKERHHMRAERDRARAWVRGLNAMIGEAMTRQALADEPREP